MAVINGFKIVDMASQSGTAPQAFIRVDGPTGYSTTITITRLPTGNCQLSSIGYLASLLKLVQSQLKLMKVEKEKENVLAILSECYRLCAYSPALVLLDVQPAWMPHVEKIFTVQHKYPYISTNGSSMCLYMVRW